MWLGIVTAVAALGLPATAAASAWPQEKGSGFASAAVHLSWPQDIRTWQSTDPTGRYDALYFEYGLTDRLTAGLDLGRRDEGKVVVGDMFVNIVAHHPDMFVAHEDVGDRLHFVSAVAGPGWV